MNAEIGKQRVVGWVLGKYCAKDLRYVLLDGHDAEVIRHDSVVSELNNQLEAQAAYSSMQFDRIAELTTEVADLKSKLDFANAMNADQDKTVAELTAEVARLVESHRYIVKTWPDSSAARHSRATVARSALKDGV